MDTLRQKQAERFAAMKAARRSRILETAITLATTQGYQWITRQGVAEAAKTSVGSINSFFGTMVGLKREVLRAAIDREILEIVAQGLADRHDFAMAAPPELKEKAAALIV